jgi:hypothetical protein
LLTIEFVEANTMTTIEIVEANYNINYGVPLIMSGQGSGAHFLVAQFL